LIPTNHPSREPERQTIAISSAGPEERNHRRIADTAPGHPIDRRRQDTMDKRWKPALNAFPITLADRWPPAETY
jgi:hypothetical protein